MLASTLVVDTVASPIVAELDPQGAIDLAIHDGWSLCDRHELGVEPLEAIERSRLMEPAEAVQPAAK